MLLRRDRAVVTQPWEHCSVGLQVGEARLPCLLGALVCRDLSPCGERRVPFDLCPLSLSFELLPILPVSSFLCALLGPSSFPPLLSTLPPPTPFLVLRTKAVRAAKRNEFKETAILDFLRTGECARAMRMGTLVRTRMRTHVAGEVPGVPY